MACSPSGVLREVPVAPRVYGLATEVPDNLEAAGDVVQHLAIRGRSPLYHPRFIREIIGMGGLLAQFPRL
jgi:hypothetical protein